MLKFAALKSDIELPFYASLASHKINHDKLNDSARRLLGLYELRPGDEPSSSCRVQLHGNAMTSDDVPAGHYRAEGMIRNMNTIEEYRGLDMIAILNQAGRTVWDAIKDGTIYSCPSLLTSFVMLCFADLKKYKFTYVVGFPALHSESAWQIDAGTASGADTGARRALTSSETIALVDTVQTWRYGVDSRQYGFFLAKKIPNMPNKHVRSSSLESVDTPTSPSSSLDFSWNVGSLSNFEAGFFDGVAKENRFICFADPSTHEEYPAWMLRNLLVLVRKRWNLSEAQIICYRDTPARRHDPKSVILTVRCDQSGPAIASGQGQAETESSMPKVTGWEKNAHGRFTSRIVNLGDYLDPQRLADQAVDLNLKLIKWRIAPSLDLEVVKNAKCLLLGAGTLGSYVSRNLLGWGVKHITFVDNGSVSYSNPVRQPLFNFQDCQDGGRIKAVRAAEALKEIYPGVETKGHAMTVPMAGHPFTKGHEATIHAEFDKLQTLVNEHDVVFLLMDTRESRWLPTVMGKAADKLVMNGALGFDSFLAMRHGVRPKETNEVELGCYFCNDVVAPADVSLLEDYPSLTNDVQSMSDRTLDQQCTVTRPGGAAIASAILVEMMVSVLQDKKRERAAAPLPGASDQQDPEHPLGIVPHQIRGSLSTFRNHIITGKSYDCCSACSDRIVDKYKTEGWEFVKRALNEKGYVEELSGLAEVQRAAEAAAADVDWDEGDDVAGDDSEAELI